MSHLVHLAAPAIRARNVIRQRCAWCGALLDEVDLDRTAVQIVEGEEPLRFVDEEGIPTRGWHGLVAVEQHGEHDAIGTVMKWAVDDPADGMVPDDSCMALPVEATA